MVNQKLIQKFKTFFYEQPLLKNVGLGRIGYLHRPMKIRDVVEVVKSHFNMKTFRLALGNGKSLDDKVKVIAAGWNLFDHYKI